MDIIPQKICNKCGDVLPHTAEYFHRDSTTKSGLKSRCKKCLSAAASGYYEEHRGKVLDAKRQYRIENPEKFKERELQRYRNNPEKEKARWADYRKRNTKKRRQAMRSWRKHNPLAIKSYSKKWYAENTERAKATAKNRRARLLAAEGTFTAADIRLQYRSQRGNCWHCGKSVGDDYHVDHLRPLAKDGSNDPRNLVVSCAPCNLSKGDRQTWEWNGRLF